MEKYLRCEWLLKYEFVPAKLQNSRREVFYKKVFLKIPQNSQKNTCVGVSF